MDIETIESAIQQLEYEPPLALPPRLSLAFRLWALSRGFAAQGSLELFTTCLLRQLLTPGDHFAEDVEAPRETLAEFVAARPQPAPILVFHVVE